jgi:hypothetical protein
MAAAVALWLCGCENQGLDMLFWGLVCSFAAGLALRDHLESRAAAAQEVVG